MKTADWKERFKNGSRYRYAAVVLLFGILLILLPRCEKVKENSEVEVNDCQTLDTTATIFSIEEEEARLQTALSRIEGVGHVEVLLSLKSTVGRELATDEEGTLVLSEGAGAETVVELYETCPEYLGAVVICSGANKAEVALAVTRAVQAYTGLGSDKITVIKGSAE
ncbi:MAG: hypothetical protein ACOX7K_03795 [Oscillospiraceae bacterium]|jgi:stage III sporulation protein AG